MISLTRWATSIALQYTTCVIKTQAYAIFLRPNRPPARQKRLFQAAGGVQRPKKDFPNARQPCSALEKTFPARRRPPARQKSLFQHVTARQRAAQDFSNAPQTASEVKKSFPTRQNRTASSESPLGSRGWSRLERSHVVSRNAPTPATRSHLFIALKNPSPWPSPRKAGARGQSQVRRKPSRVRETMPTVISK